MEYGELPVFVFEDAHQPLLPSWVVTCITINVIMGSGFLGVPSAFLSSGPLLGALVLLVVSVLMWIAACYLAQVASRAHALLVDEKSAATLTPTLTPLSALNNAIAEKPGEMPSLLIPSHTSYEIPMLCRLYLGRWVERFVMISLGLFQLGSLWSYASVFASSMAAIVPLPGLLGEEQSMEPCDIYKTDTYGGGCITLYYFWALSFAVAMVALLGLDVREQAYMQCFMTLLRAVILAVMVGTLLFGSRSDFGLSSSPDQTAAGPPAVRWDGLPRVVLTSVFCQSVQMGIPSLLQPLRCKTDFPAIFGCALASTGFMYTALGVAAVYLLGDDVDPSCNLSWSSYRNPYLSVVVSLFPAIDCFSVFPINAIFLANNLLAVVYQRKWHAGEVGRRTKYFFRLACCVPAFVCAFAFPSLAKALDFTGVVGVILPFIVTPLLFIASLRKGRAKWGIQRFDEAEAEGQYARYGFAKTSLVAALGICGVLLLVYSVCDGIINGF